MKLLLVFLSLSFYLEAQHLWQKPKAPISQTYLSKLIGPIETTEPSREINILWLYGYDKHHIPGAHDYVKVKDLMTKLLKSVPKVTLDEAYQFPSDAQLSSADLIVMYLHFEALDDQKIIKLQNYIDQGGSIVALHESLIIRPAEQGAKLSKCFGCAWNEGQSKWGAIFTDISIDNHHSIFKNFPTNLTLHDEFYWNLHQEKESRILGAVRTGPQGNSKKTIQKSQLTKKPQPVFWTYEIGEGRVFATSAGHNTFSYYDPEFRLILFRAMAWALGEKPDPFMPLVSSGITQNGKVGTTNTMRHWKGKKRK